MAIFGNFNSTEKIDLPVYEGYGLDDCAFMEAFVEDLDAELAVIEAMHAYDMTEIEGLRKISAMTESSYSDEEDYIITEAKTELKSLLEAASEKVKKSIGDRIRNIWGKIRAFFVSVIAKIKNFFSRNKDFLVKYKKALDKVEKKTDIKFTVKGFNFNHDQMGTAFSAAISDVNKYADDKIDEFRRTVRDLKTEEEINEFISSSFRDSFKEDLDDVRGAAFGDGTPMTAEEYQDYLFDFFRGQDAHKNREGVDVTINISKIKECRSFLSIYNNQLAAVDKAKTQCDNIFNQLIAEINKPFPGDKEELDEKRYSIINKVVTIVTASNGIVTQAFNAWTSALNDYSAFSQKVLLQAIKESK